MQTTLDYIDGSAKRAIASALEHPTLPPGAEEALLASNSPNIAGFKTIDAAGIEKERSDRLKNRRSEINRYLEHADAFRTKLVKLGVTPLAVLPKTMWEEICRKSGLYLLTPDAGGYVQASTAVLKKFEDEITPKINRDRMVGRSIFLAFAGVAGLGAFFSHGVALAFFDGIFFIACLFGAVFWHMSIFTRKRVFRGEYNEFSEELVSFVFIGKMRRRIEEFGNGPKNKILEALFPDHVASSGKQSMSLRVSYPDPPKEVGQTLQVVQSMYPKTALVGEAISFVDHPGQALAEVFDHDMKVQQQRYEEFIRWPDPIIYVEQEGVVAVVAQFGDFPVEKEVVDTAFFSQYLFLSEGSARR